MGLPHLESFVGVFFEGLKTPQKALNRLLEPGEIFVVPRGVEHRPVATEEVHMLLIEPKGTPNTGDKSTAAPRQAI